MNLKSNQKGFTIVELLIVIVVIAILAAISIVAFTGIQQRGRDSRRASDTANIVKALTAFTADDEQGGSWADVNTHTNAASELGSYTGANLDSTLLGRLQSGAPAASNAIEYQYTPLCTGAGNYTGAQISYYKENGGTTVNVTAGTGTTTCA